MPHHHKVQRPVPVEIPPGAAHRAIGSIRVRQPRRWRYIHETPISLIAKQLTSAPIGDKQILVAVIIIIRGAAPVALGIGVQHARIPRYIGKSAIAVIAVKGAFPVAVRRQPRQIRRCRYIYIRPPIAVIIKHHHPRAQRYNVQQVAVMGERHARPFPHFIEHRRLVSQGPRQ